MKNFKKLITMMLMLASVFFFSCSKDDEVEKMSPDEAQATLNEMSTSMISNFDIIETEGLDAMGFLMNLQNPFTSTTKSTKPNSVLNNINEFVNLKDINNRNKVINAEPFNFSDLTGTYEWHNSLQRWSVDPTSPIDAIVIIFPTDSLNLDNNNGTVTISNYSEILINDADSSYYNPTSISADLKIDGIKYLGIDLEATWNTSTGEPTYLSLSLFLKPFTFRGELEQNDNNVGLGFYIDFNDQSLFLTTIDAEFETTNLDDDPILIAGSLKYGDIDIDASLKLKDLALLEENINNGTITDTQEIEDALNENLNATVSYQNKFVADIELRYNPLAYIGVDPEDYDDVFPFYPVFVFSDGSEQLAMPFFVTFATSLQEFFVYIQGYVAGFLGEDSGSGM